MEKSRIYQLYELRDEMTSAIDNCKKVVESSKDLVQVINKSKKESLKDLANETEKNIATYEQQISRMEQRKVCIIELIEMYEKKDDISKVVELVVSNLLEGIGATHETSEENN